jgi:hypothetical protein
MRWAPAHDIREDTRKSSARDARRSRRGLGRNLADRSGRCEIRRCSGTTVSRSKDPLFFVCRGKSCRRRKKKHAAVLEALSRVAPVRQVACQSICEGPVVGYRSRKATTWFRGVDSKKVRKRLLALARRGKMTRPLKKRHCGV